MADDPSFPDPSEAKRKPAESYRTSTPPAKDDKEPPRVVVTRAEAPKEEAAPAAGPKGALKLSPEEVAALLAVDGTNRMTASKAVLKRGRVIALPLTLVDLVLNVILGDYGMYISIALTIGVVAWTTRPLWNRDGWS